MKFVRPCAGKILVKPIRETESNGIIFADTAHKDLQSQFHVVAVGKGRIKKLKNGTFLRLNPEVLPGQRIVANTWAGKELEIDGITHRLIDQTAVQAVIEA